MPESVRCTGQSSHQATATVATASAGIPLVLPAGPAAAVRDVVPRASWAGLLSRVLSLVCIHSENQSQASARCRGVALLRFCMLLAGGWHGCMQLFFRTDTHVSSAVLRHSNFYVHRDFTFSHCLIVC